MNTRIIKIFVTASLFVMLTALVANAQDLKLKAHVPFDFVYGDVTMPAGDYDLTKLNMMVNSVFCLRDANDKNIAMRNTMRVTRAKATNETILVFNRYRENGGEVSNFLTKIWVEGDPNGFEFIKHRTEIEAAKRAATRDIITIVVKRVTTATE